MDLNIFFLSVPLKIGIFGFPFLHFLVYIVYLHIHKKHAVLKRLYEIKGET